ncbi:hypothetical protein PM082_006483 [Marasmius tenuissimus]|nr:hypothetical protein PM082_006483 [Marasmius tenuissimus]
MLSPTTPMSTAVEPPQSTVETPGSAGSTPDVLLLQDQSTPVLPSGLPRYLLVHPSSRSATTTTRHESPSSEPAEGEYDTESINPQVPSTRPVSPPGLGPSTFEDPALGIPVSRILSKLYNATLGVDPGSGKMTVQNFVQLVKSVYTNDDELAGDWAADTVVIKAEKEKEGELTPGLVALGEPRVPREEFIKGWRDEVADADEDVVTEVEGEKEVGNGQDMDVDSGEKMQT